MYIRKQNFIDAGNESFFLWGARQTGKSTLLKTLYFQIDFVLGDHEVGLEVKPTDHAHHRHLRNLKHFGEEYAVKKLILVSNDPQPRRIGNIMVLPWSVFLEKLWSGEIIK